ncbi:hypothetical protein GCM10010980_24220 [Corynebacterium marinum]|nr:hypothetical protein GCM10010980_24220 [Corynebacterium marinum]
MPPTATAFRAPSPEEQATRVTAVSTAATAMAALRGVRDMDENSFVREGGKETGVLALPETSTPPKQVIVLPGGRSAATLPTSALNPAVGVTRSEAS